MSDFFMEDLAEMAIKNAKEFLDLETGALKVEHEFEFGIANCEQIVGHLDERIPPEDKHLHYLNGKITDKLGELSALLQEEEHLGLEIKSTAEEYFARIRVGGHVEKDEKKLIKEFLRGLVKVHSLVKDIEKLIKDSKVVKMAKKDAAPEDYVNMEEYYFHQVHKIISSYDQIIYNIIIKLDSLI